MKSKNTIMVRIPTEIHSKLKELKNHTEHSYVWILTKAVNNYWKAVIKNRLNTKK